MYPIEQIYSLSPRMSEEERVLIAQAYEFAEIAHAGKLLPSGNPYFEHAFETAKILATVGVDSQTVAGGLLHDTLEEGSATAEEIEKVFGKDMRLLVTDITELNKLKYRHGVDRYLESLQKLFVAMAHDVRAIVVKFAGRIHVMRTLKYFPPAERKILAEETLELLAPLAERLGMRTFRGELQDLAFRYVYPEEYTHTKKLFESRSREARQKLEHTYRHLQKRLATEKITNISVEFRVKYLYSLYRKLLKHDMDIEDIYDIQALRIIVPTVEDCYKILGIIHDIWTPLPGRIKDYIATPKPSGYQSLHTTIFTGDGGIAEIQIRTREMHREAEYGVASHVTYSAAEKPLGGGAIKGKKLRWVKRLLEWQEHASESPNLWEEVVLDLLKDKIFVFTPKGDVIELPEDSTPIDFAYAIHSNIGTHAYGAEVGQKFVSLSTKLKSGDVVKILTKKNNTPNQKWLEYVKTTLAKRQIRNYLHKQKIFSEPKSKLLRR